MQRKAKRPADVMDGICNDKGAVTWTLFRLASGTLEDPGEWGEIKSGP